MADSQGRGRRHIRTLFLSDVHLGCRHSQASALLEFLSRYSPECVFIVGDFIDGWALRRGVRWRSEYSRLIECLSDMACAGTRLFYASGNHDAFLRDRNTCRQLSRRFGVAEIAEEFVFETADHRRFLVTHGDRFDAVERSAQWLSKGTTSIYDAALSCNWYFSGLIRRNDQSPYRLCARLKDRVKRVIRFLSSFENALLRHAESRGCDGVICGHVHSPTIVNRNGMTYCNTGDWVENCTALIEQPDGTLELEYFYQGAAPRRAPRSSGVPRPVKAARQRDEFRCRTRAGLAVNENPVGIGR